MTERDIFISRIQMYYDRYGIDRSAENDADSLLAGAFEREVYPEVNTLKKFLNRMVVMKW